MKSELLDIATLAVETMAISTCFRFRKVSNNKYISYCHSINTPQRQNDHEIHSNYATPKQQVQPIQHVNAIFRYKSKHASLSDSNSTLANTTTPSLVVVLQIRMRDSHIQRSTDILGFYLRNKYCPYPFKSCVQEHLKVYSKEIWTKVTMFPSNKVI